MNKLSIVIPVYNEVSMIDKVVETVLKKTISGWKKEIIVVDDGSTDGTPDKLKKWKKEVEVILSEKTVPEGIF